MWRRVAPLLVASLAALVGACSTCGRVYDAWTDALRVEVAHVGLGELADTGLDDHVRWIFGPEVVSLLAEPLDETAVLSPASDAVTLDDGRSDAARVDLAVRVVVRRVGAVDDAELGPALRVSLELDTVGSSLRVRTARGDVTWGVEGAVELVVPLVVSGRDDGVDVLLAMNDARVESASLDTAWLEALDDAPSADVLATAVALYDDLVRDMLDDAPSTIELLTVPALVVEGVALRGVPSRFGVTDSGALVVGLVTPLRPSGDVASSPSLVHGAPFAVELHPGLPLAALRADLVDGTVPRLRDDVGQPSVDGRFGVTVDALSLRGSGVTWSFRWWCLTGERCYRADMVGQGSVRLGDGRLTVEPSAAVVRDVSSSVVFDPATTSPFVARVGERMSGLLTPGTVRVLDRWRLEPRVEELAAGADRLRVAGDIALVEVDLLRGSGVRTAP